MPSLPGLSVAPGDRIARDTETERATPNVAVPVVDRSGVGRGPVVSRVWDLVRWRTGLRIDAAEMCMGSWGAGDAALVGWERRAEALVTVEGCRGRISQTGSLPSIWARQGLGGSGRVATMVSFSLSESKLRSEVGLEVREREGVSG